MFRLNSGPFVAGALFCVGLAIGFSFSTFSGFREIDTAQAFVLPESDPLSELDMLTLRDLPAVNADGFLARIEQNSPEELERVFLHAEALFEQGKITRGDPPITFVIHGPEVQVFLEENYYRYQSIVDLAAKLSAFNVVDVSVCQTRMGVLDQSPSELHPFVGTVPFGPAEIDRLLGEENYVKF